MCACFILWKGLKIKVRPLQPHGQRQRHRVVFSQKCLTNRSWSVSRSLMRPSMHTIVVVSQHTLDSTHKLETLPCLHPSSYRSVGTRKRRSGGACLGHARVGYRLFHLHVGHARGGSAERMIAIVATGIYWVRILAVSIAC